MTSPVTPDIQGLPPGAIVKPVSATPPPASIQGLPPGAVVKPIGGGVSAAPQQNDSISANPGQVEPKNPADDVIGAMADNISAPVVGTVKGFVKGGAKTVAGLLGLLGRGMGANDTMMQGVANAVGSAMGVKPQPAQPDTIQQHVKGAADWINAHAQDHGVWQHIGDFGEGALELMTPEGLAGMAGKIGKAGEAVADAVKSGEAVNATAQKYAEAAKVAKFLDANPKIKALVSIGGAALRSGARAGVESGAQTFVKSGGDPEATGEAAGVGALLGGTIGGGVKTVGVARDAYKATADKAAATLSDYHQARADYHQAVADRATATDNANAEWRTQTDAQNQTYRNALAQQDADHAVAMEQHRTALTERAAGIQKARDEWKAAIDEQTRSHSAAMDAYTTQVGERTAAQDQARTAWKAQLDAQATQHAADVDAYNQQLGEHTQTVKQLQTEAANTLKMQRQIEAQQGIKNTAKDAVENALQRFNSVAGGAGGVDATAAKEDVNDFGDAADALRSAAKPIYEEVNEATGGKFSELQEQRSAAIRAQDFAASDKAESAINSLLYENPGVKPEVYRAARSAWHDSKDLDRIHIAVEGAFNGIPEDIAAQHGTGTRTVSGDSLQTRLGSLLKGPKRLAPERITQLIGPDGLTGLYRAAHLTSTPELRTATQQLVQEIAEHLPPPKAPIKPIPVEQPAPLPKPDKPVRATAPDAPALPPKPIAPVRPAGVERPETIPRPQPLPRPVAPTPPKRASANETLARAIGGHTAEGIAGLAIGHATGVPYPYAIGGVAASRYVWRQIVTNPAVGKMAQYAVEYGATPKNAGKVIAEMIVQAETAKGNKAAK